MLWNKFRLLVLINLFSFLFVTKANGLDLFQVKTTLIQAQQVAQLPNPITPEPEDVPVPVPTDPPEPELTPNIPSSESTIEIPGTVRIERFEFEGNTVFSDEELAEVTADYVGRELSFNQLLEAEAAVRAKYQSGCNDGTEQPCYINSDAVIPAQKIEDGVVTIQVVEGGLEAIEVVGLDRLDADYIRSRLAQGEDKPFDLNELLQSLRLLQLDPLVGQISAELSTGIRRERSLLVVTIEEADSFDVVSFINNGRSPSVGSFRRGVSLTERNLFGFGDELDFSWSNTDGSDSFDAGYAIPINADDGKLVFAGGYRDTEIIEEPFDRIDLTGDSVYYQLTYRQPIQRSPESEFTLEFTLSRQESQTELDGEGFSLSRGANADGETRISALRFSQQYLERRATEVVAFFSQFSLGVDAFDATNNDDLPDSQFLAWRGQGQYVRLLDQDTLLVLRSDIQFASDELLPLEKFSLGGLYTVRGYRQDTFLTDNGVFTSAEVRLPLLRVDEVDGLLQIVPFVDFGVGWNNGDLEPQGERDNTLIGVGVGLQWQMGDLLNARFDWGIPLTDTNVEDEDTWQEQGFYFTINYRLF